MIADWLDPENEQLFGTAYTSLIFFGDDPGIDNTVLVDILKKLIPRRPFLWNYFEFSQALPILRLFALLCFPENALPR